MEIGGIDVTFSALAGTPVSEIILRRVRVMWPEGLFEDALSASPEKHSLTDEWVWLCGTGAREFFVYRDQTAAEAWDRDGGVDENQPTMLHFLIDIHLQGRMRCVTMVHGERGPKLDELIRDLRKSFRLPLVRHREATAA